VPSELPRGCGRVDRVNTFFVVRFRVWISRFNFLHFSIGSYWVKSTCRVWERLYYRQYVSVLKHCTDPWGVLSEVLNQTYCCWMDEALSGGKSFSPVLEDLPRLSATLFLGE